jgi:carbon monoxide dehydrogenase subunit G
MELEGTKVIAADRATVWKRLNDPAVLKSAIPGCTDLTGSPEEGFAATVVQKVGPVKATFRGEVRLTDVVPGESYRLIGEGRGGVAGFAKGQADVRLRDVPEGTELSYKVDAQVGGKLAQLGNRIIGGFARKMADDFFERFVTGPDAGPDAGQDAGA